MCFTSDSVLLGLIPERFKQHLSNRTLNCGIKNSQLQRSVLLELHALLRLRYSRITTEQILFERNRAFQRSLPNSLFRNSDVVIGFDTSSWIAAERAAKLGKPFILDQSIAHPNEKEAVYATLREQFPDWREDIEAKQVQYIELEQREYQLASKIVVASSFTKNSLVKHGIEASKIVVNPYGVSPEFFRPRNENKKGKFRFLFLGLVGARKGLPLILDVWKERKMNRCAELVIVGPMPNHHLSKIQGYEGVTYFGKMPLSKIPEILDTSHCLLFPSYFEGFGQVILEAMAGGLLVITTDATAGPDIIENGTDGLLIRAGDKKSLAENMRRLANDPSLCIEMGARAAEKARSFSWDAYGDRWKNILDEVS